MRRLGVKTNQKRRRTNRGHYIMELILLGNGVLPEERLDYELGYPTYFKYVLKQMRINHEIKFREIDGTKLVVVGAKGLNIVKWLKEKKPDVFNKHWGERCFQKGIDIDNFIVPR